MKRRLLLFLTIFGVGLALLWWFERRPDVKPEDADVAAVSTPVAERPEDTFVEVPVKIGEKDEERGVEVSFRGAVSARVFTDSEPRVLEWVVAGEDTEPLGDELYDFRGASLQRFHPESNELILSANAATAHLKLDPADPEVPVDPSYDVVLRDVDALVQQQIVFAPIELHTEEMRCSLASKLLSTESDVEVTGRGLRAIGSGLRADTAHRTLTFGSNASLEVRRPGGRTAALSSTGPLDARTRTEERSFAVLAKGEALLEIRAAAEASERDALLTGDEIEIFGRSAQEGDEPFRLESVVAVGNAVLRTVDGEFLAEDATIEFDANGSPSRAFLVGKPRVVADLRRRGERPAGDAEVIHVELSGAGPLTLELTAAQRGAFELQGASELRVPTYGAALRASKGMRGVRTQAGRLGRLIATGDVAGELEGGSLTAEELEIAAVSAREDEIAILLTSRGETHIEGPLSDGRRYDLVATGGLSYRRTEETFQVPEARGVTLRIDGDVPYEAALGHLLNLNGESLSFQASGGVSFAAPIGRGSGEGLVARGGQSGVLHGTPERPAQLEHADGWLEAADIDFSEGRLRAEGQASGTWDSGDVSATLDALWIEVSRAGNERTVTAGDGIDALVKAGERSLAVEARDLEVRGLVFRDPRSGSERLTAAKLTALHDVIVDYHGEAEIVGHGERFELELSGASSGSGRLEPEPGERLRTSGRLPGEGVSFELLSETLAFDRESLRADNAVLDVDGITVGLTSAEARETGGLRAIAGRIEARADSISLDESVYLGRFGDRGDVWSLDSEHARIVGVPPSDQEGSAPVLTRLEAWDGFTLRFDRGMQAEGERLEVDRDEERVRMTGDPVRVQVPGAQWTAKSFEIDPEVGSVRASRGSLRLDSQDGSAAPWTLSYKSIEPRLDSDQTIQVVSQPIFLDGTRVVRADWAVFWIDPQGFRALTTGADDGGPSATDTPRDDAPPAPPRMPSLFGGLGPERGIGWLRELYLDGDLEVLESGLRQARAEAVYLDFIDGHGWLYDADFTMRSGAQVGRLHADWLRHSADGSLRADSAVLTSCDFDVPHYTVESGSLAIEPRVDPLGEDSHWFIELRDNAIRFAEGPALPLPKIGFAMREDYSVDTDQISVFGARPFSVGSSARFGTFVRTSVASDFSGFARGFHRFLRKLIPKGSLRMPDLPGFASLGKIDFGPPPEGEFSASAAYLGSRGGLLDLGVDIESHEFYRLRFDGAVVLDAGRDRGLIRVPKSDREQIRWWLRERGRIDIGEDHWVDAVLTTQSDPSVQSEFFEGDYVRYEERETYLNWRRADGEKYANVTVEARPDDWRTDVLEQPSGRYYSGRRQVTTWGETPVYYGSDSTIGRLSRIEGDPLYEAGFADGFGDGDSWRADTRHRWEVPTSLAWWGLRATPFVEAVGSVWSESATGGSAPARAGVLAGLEVASTIWKPLGDDGLHELTASVGLRTDVAVEESGGTPFTFDSIERSLEGRFLDMKVRSLLTTSGADHRWDLELALTHAEDSPDVPDGLQPIQVNTDWVTSVGDTLLGVYHDGRYDLRTGRARYQRTIFGVEPTPAVAFGLGHNLGRNTLDKRIYEALTLAARWRLNPKFELEGRQSVSLIHDGSLYTEGIIRRYGHDFVIEIELSHRRGEGTSFSFGVEPTLLFKPSSFGFVERLRYAQNDR